MGRYLFLIKILVLCQKFWHERWNWLPRKARSEGKLARNLDTQVVGADTDQRRVDQTTISGSNTVWVGSVGEDNLSISITLAIVVVWSSVGSNSVGESNTLGHWVQSLSDGVQTGLWSEWDSSIHWVSLTLLVMVSGSTWDWDIGSIDTGGTLQTNHSTKVSIWVVREELARDGSEQGGGKSLKQYFCCTTIGYCTILQCYCNIIPFFVTSILQ